MRNTKWAYILCGLFLALVFSWGIFLHGVVSGLHETKLPGRINTVAEGYPIALEMKNRIAPDANLASVDVELERKGDGFEADALNYLFISRAGTGRSVLISIINARQRAYIVMNHASISRHPFFPSWELKPLALPRIDIPELIQIANANGLKEFCTRAPGDSGVVGLTLGSSTNVPFWLIVGTGWGDKEGIEGVHLEIDAHSGAVLSDSLEKAVRRLNLK